MHALLRITSVMQDYLLRGHLSKYKNNKIEPRHAISSCTLRLLFLSQEFFNIAHKLQGNA
jgi:hypothetical protein